MQDDAVVAAARLGDADAWQELYQAHAGRLLLWLRMRPIVDVAVTADDLAAETWMTAARRLPAFKGDQDAFAGWLFGIARNVVHNQVRRARFRAHDGWNDGDVESALACHGPEVIIPGADWVRATLSCLPPRERDVLACMEVVGLDAESTARALGIKTVTVRVLRHRGLKRLRTVLGPAVPDACAVSGKVNEAARP